MSLGRVLVEEFQAEVLKWLRERVDLVENTLIELLVLLPCLADAADGLGG